MDNAIIGLFDACLQEAIAVRKEQTEIPSPFYDQGEIEDSWPVCDDAYNGDLWKHLGALPSWKSRPDDNMIFQAVESNTTKLTDSRPRVGFVPREADDYPTVKLVQAYFDAWWEWARGAMALYLAVKDSRKFGTGWLNIEWSPKKRQQVLRAVHPETVLVDPDCTVDDFDPSYLIYEYMVSVGELKSAYPNADWEHFNDTKHAAGWFDRILKRFMVNTTARNPVKSVTCYDFYIKDAAMQTFTVYEGELGVKVSKRKYPGMRKVVISGGIVLEDRPDIYKHGKVPFVPISAYPETGKFYGHGDASRLLPDQILLNRIDQYLMDATFKSTGGIGLVNKRFGLTKGSITNDPVQIREVSDVNQAFRWIQQPSPARHMFDLRASVRKAGDDKAGIHDISRGAYTPGNKTVAEVNVLAESDNTRVRMAARFLGMAIETLGGLWMSNVAQFEDKSTILRITHSDGTEESVQTNPADMLRRNVVDDEEGKVVDWDTLALDIKVADTSTLPARQQELAQQALMLAQSNIIDRENLLEVLDWPDREAMISRMKMEEAKQPPPGAPQGPPQGEPQGEPQGSPDMPPPEVMQQVMQIAQETGQDPQAILDQIAATMGGSFDTAYPNNRMTDNAPVPVM